VRFSSLCVCVWSIGNHSHMGQVSRSVARTLGKRAWPTVPSLAIGPASYLTVSEAAGRNQRNEKHYLSTTANEAVERERIHRSWARSRHVLAK